MTVKFCYFTIFRLFTTSSTVVLLKRLKEWSTRENSCNSRYESGELGNAFCFHTAGQGDVEGFILKHVVSRWTRKGRKMWGFSPLSTLLLFSIFIAVHSEEKQDVRKGAIVRARLEVCSGPYFLDRMKAYCGSCILFSLYSSYWY